MLKHFFYFCLVICCLSCGHENSVKTGDVIFRSMNASALSQAINEVTQTDLKTNYSHMGVCFLDKDAIFVYHSDLGKGVVKEPLELFLQPTDSSRYFADLYRVKAKIKPNFETLISTADSMLGAPYNKSYIFEDQGYYCSEFVYELFKNDSVFTLEPMTFKDLKTNRFHPNWVEYYQSLGVSIPEGQLGCNPNGMANSNALEFVKQFK